MKNEPCIRFGIRISPKISEKPADNRNSRPPSAMLFTARRTQTLMLFSDDLVQDGRKDAQRHRGFGRLPLPVGERGGVRGCVTLDRFVPPHALTCQPLPRGERPRK